MVDAATTVERQTETSIPSPALALRRAWVIWFALLGSPFVLFLVTVWHLTDEEVSSATPPAPALARVWFLGSMAYLALVIPAAFFWRSRIFKAYWTGQVVGPRDYLKGMLTIWLALDIGGFVALAGCLISGRILPCLLPALVAFIIFVPLWPSGRAMTRPVGNQDDPELYEDPR
jgi:hypothetical protein